MPSKLTLGHKLGTPLRSITITAMLLTVLLGLEYALVAVPNVQLTVVVLMVYSVLLPWKMLLGLVGAYVFLDNLWMGTLNIIYFVPMLLAWFFLVIITKLIAKKPFWIILTFGALFGFFYGWFFIPVQVILYGIDRLWPYFVADLPFELTMVLSNFLSIIALFNPLKRTLSQLINPESDFFEESL